MPSYFSDAELALSDLEHRVSHLESGGRLFATVHDAPEGIDPLQWLLNPNETTHRRPVLISGYHEFAKTLVTAPNHGLAIYNAGRILDHRVDPTSDLRGAGAMLYWVGNAGGTMWEYRGVGLSGNLPTISGGPNKDLRAGIGLLVHRHSAINPIKSAIQSAQFLNLDVGIQCGKTDGEHGCDNLYVDNLYLWECDYGVRLNTLQSMDHHFGSVYSNDCRVIFRVDAGGRFSCDSLAAIERTETILQIGSGGIGVNNASFWLSNVKVDQAARRAVIVDMLASKAVAVSVDGVHVASPEPGRVCYRMRAPGALTVRHHYYLPPGSIETYRSTQPREVSNICLERCLVGRAVAADPAKLLTDSSRAVVLTLRDCWDIDGQPVPDAVVRR